MRQRNWIILTIIITFSHLIFFNSNIIYIFQGILVLAWVNYKYISFNFSIFYVFIGGFIVELFTFQEIGIYSLSYCIANLLLIIIKKYISPLYAEKGNRMFIIGLACNTILFFLLNYIIGNKSQLLYVIFSLLINVLLLLFLLKTISVSKSQKYDS